VTPIVGPDDVKVDDVVQHTDLSAYRPRTRIAQVVRATAARLTVRFADGETLCSPYTKKVKSSSWGRTTSSVRPVFQLLDAHDRWRHATPRHEHVTLIDEKTVIVAWEVLTNEQARHEVQAHLDALAAWFATKPAKDAP